MYQQPPNAQIIYGQGQVPAVAQPGMYGQPAFPGQPQPAYGVPAAYGQPAFSGQMVQPAYGMPAAVGQPLLQPPVMVQPQIQWMPPVEGTFPDCPPGLESLAVVDRVLVRQHLELLEVVAAMTISNKYSILNGAGQQMFWASENTVGQAISWVPKTSWRAFTMNLTDQFNREIIRLIRPPPSINFPCCNVKDEDQDFVQVECPPGYISASVKQVYDGCNNRFQVMDSQKRPILHILHVQSCATCCELNWVFDVFASDGSTKIGTITKEWAGYTQEVYTRATNFTIQFPMDLAVTLKAALISASILFDFMFFDANKRRDRGGSSIHNQHHHPF